MVLGEWVNYYNYLAAIKPVQSATYNSAPSTTYTQDTPDLILNDGLPDSFTFDMANIAGTEDSLNPREGATVFYTSSNGGGRPDSVGVAGWDLPGGRVISFSTLITQIELASPDYQQLVINAVNWARPADLTITKSASPDPVDAGSNITYTLTATNNGPSSALSITMADELPAEATFQALEAPPDWACTTPNVGETGTVTCTTSSWAAAATADFTLIANVNSDVADGTVINNTASIGASTFDPDPDSNTASAAVVVSNPSQ